MTLPNPSLPPWLESYNIEVKTDQHKDFAFLGARHRTTFTSRHSIVEAGVFYQGLFKGNSRRWRATFPYDVMIEVHPYEGPEYQAVAMWWALLKLGAQPLTVEMFEHLRETLVTIPYNLGLTWLGDYSKKTGVHI